MKPAPCPVFQEIWETGTGGPPAEGAAGKEHWEGRETFRGRKNVCRGRKTGQGPGSYRGKDGAAARRGQRPVPCRPGGRLDRRCGAKERARHLPPSGRAARTPLCRAEL